MSASRYAPSRTFRAGQRVSQVVDRAHIGTSRPSLLAASSAAWSARSCAPDQRSARVRQPLEHPSACAQWARSWHVEEAAKEGTASIVARTIDTSSSRPGASVSRFHARIVTHFRPSPGGEAGHLDAQRCARSGPTRSQVGVDRAHQQRAVEQP